MTRSPDSIPAQQLPAGFCWSDDDKQTWDVRNEIECAIRDLADTRAVVVGVTPSGDDIPGEGITSGKEWLRLDAIGIEDDPTLIPSDWFFVDVRDDFAECKVRAARVERRDGFNKLTALVEWRVDDATGAKEQE